MNNINNNNNNYSWNEPYIGQKQKRRSIEYQSPANKFGQTKSNNSSLVKRLDAIDQNYQYKPSLYEIFNRIDASIISPTQ